MAADADDVAAQLPPLLPHDAAAADAIARRAGRDVAKGKEGRKRQGERLPFSPFLEETKKGKWKTYRFHMSPRKCSRWIGRFYGRILRRLYDILLFGANRGAHMALFSLLGAREKTRKKRKEAEADVG